MLNDPPISSININGRIIGPGKPCFIIAEAGVNHNGNVDLALRLIDAAADAGADAVKFQTFVAERTVTHNAPKAAYQVNIQDHDHCSQFEMLKSLELDERAHAELIRHAHDRNLLFLSTPDDASCARLLADLGTPCLKIGSPDLISIPFLEDISSINLPVILSTGMGSIEEIDRAISALRSIHHIPIALLHCISQYPSPPSEMNLKCIVTLSERYDLPVGLSDHTLGIDIAPATIGLGCSIIEKHLTLDQTLPGPDHKASLEPNRFAELVQQIRLVESAMGDGVKRCMPCEAGNRDIVRKSLATARHLSAGQELRSSDVWLLRPGTGLAPFQLKNLVGRRLRHDIPAGQLLKLDDFI